MERKKWVAITDANPENLKFREKRKWQIALRRYTIEKNNCVLYAPYFGLDINNIRKWFESQFQNKTGWDDFAKKWQFEHVIPVSYFDFTSEKDLKLCWNFLNLRIAHLKANNEPRKQTNLLAARKYFQEISTISNYPLCAGFLQKVDNIELAEKIDSQKQQMFLQDNQAYHNILTNYTAHEFELLNAGRSIDEINKEMAFFKKFAPDQ